VRDWLNKNRRKSNNRMLDAIINTNISILWKDFSLELELVLKGVAAH